MKAPRLGALRLRAPRFIPPRVDAFLRSGALGAFLVYFVGVALRVRYTFDIHPPERFLDSDMYFYTALARRLQDTTVPLAPWDVTHPLGYPAFIALLTSGGGSLGGVVAVQLVLSCLVPIAVGLIGAAAFGRRTGLLALAAASLYFPFIEFGALFLSEIHFIFWLSLAFAGFLGARGARRRAVAVGLSLAGGFALSLAISMKNVGLLAAIGFFAVEGLALLLARAPRSGGAPAWHARLRPWVLRVAMVAVGAAPVMGAMARICTRANGGHFCFAGNKPAADFLLGHYGRIAGITWAEDQGHGYFFGSPGSHLRHYDDKAAVPYVISDNASNAAEAWRWIAAHPWEAVVLSLDHIYDTFLGAAMWPSFGHASWHYAHFFQYVFVVLLFLPTLYACVRVGRRGVRAFLTSRTALVLAPVVALTVTVAIATGEVRYRIPFDIFFIAVAGALATGDLRRES